MWMMCWYSLVFVSIIIIYFTTGMSFIYGLEAWNDLQTNPFTITLNIICIIVFMGDVYVQLNAGFLHRGMIIMEIERSVSRYLRYFFIIDIVLVVILIVSMVSDDFYMNFLKIIIALKFIRMFEIDGLFMRKLSTSPNYKALYVIGKQLITIFVIAHTIGTIYYAIDYKISQSPTCQNDNSRTFVVNHSMLVVLCYCAFSYHGLRMAITLLLLALLGNQHHYNHQLRWYCPKQSIIDSFLPCLLLLQLDDLWICGQQHHSDHHRGKISAGQLQSSTDSIHHIHGQFTDQQGRTVLIQRLPWESILWGEGKKFRAWGRDEESSACRFERRTIQERLW